MFLLLSLIYRLFLFLSPFSYSLYLYLYFYFPLFLYSFILTQQKDLTYIILQDARTTAADAHLVYVG